MARDRKPGTGQIVGIAVSKKRRPLSNLSPYAKPFDGADLREVMATTGLSKVQVATLTGYTTRSVETWLSDKQPVPLLVRRVLRASVLGGVSLNALWCC